MELARLKARLKTARRGHKLLYDQRQELMRRLLAQAEQARHLRAESERLLSAGRAAQDRAAAILRPEVLAGALLCAPPAVQVETSVRSCAGVSVPEFSLSAAGQTARFYGYAQTTAATDEMMDAYAAALPVLLRLAEAEKSVQLLARKIEMTRRRVNALEHVLIPELAASVRRISMRLEENERGNLVRLMKVKELVLADARRKNTGDFRE